MDSRWNGVLEPLSAERPYGEDLSFSSEFDRIHEARREDDPTVDYGDWQIALKQADWPAVVACCSDLLHTRSKDLRLAAWLAEGLVKISGLNGLADGMQITARLIERFGPHLHPQAEEDDQEQRIGTLSWYVMRMSQLVRQIPFTQGAAGQFSLNDDESARHLHAQLQRDGDAVQGLDQKMTLEKISAAIAKTDKGLYIQWLEESKRCRALVEELSQACDSLFGIDGPSFSQLIESIEAMHQRLQTIARDLGIVSAAEGAVGVEPEGSLPEALDSPVRHGPIRTRAQALESLRQVASFFRNTEPHSPVAYLADKAVHWGSMPLHSWLRSVVKDHGTLSHLEEMLGLNRDAKAGQADD